MISYNTGLQGVIEKYDHFIVDLWGVIHDGRNLYPNVLECLEQFYLHNKEIIFLSNAPRRKIVVEKKLTELGVERKLYKDIVTSGELAFLNLNNNKIEDIKGNRFYVLGPERDSGLLSESLRTERVEYIDDAEFAVLLGFKNDDSNLESMQIEIEECIANNLTMICANPDILVVRQNEEKFLCAGYIAKHYEKLGGKVIYFGKPYYDIYEYTFNLFGKDVDKNKVLAIGDNLETDIKGANNFGIDCCLVASGVIKNKIFPNHSDEPDLTKLEDLFNKYKVKSTYFSKAFNW